MGIKYSSNKQRGLYAERKALSYLQRQGLQLICANYQCRFGEIDLIMQQDFTASRVREAMHSSLLIFIEVRMRSAAVSNACASVGPKKQRRIVRSAAFFLQQNPQYVEIPCRFDVLASNGRKLSWLKAAFSADCEA